MSGYKISNKLNIGTYVVYNILKINNVKTRTDREQAIKYKINEKYFDKIDTEEKAYWLGFIYADGYISKKTGKSSSSKKFGLSLMESDRSHIEKLNKSFDSTYPIHSYSVSKKYAYNPNSRYSRLIITNEHLCNSLISKGVLEHKSTILKPPDKNCLSSKFYYPFIRGYIDGNGSVLIYQPSRKKAQEFEIKICGTKEILSWILKCIGKENLKIYRKKNIKVNNWQVSISGNKQVLFILDEIYKDATVYLDRKYNEYKKMKSIYNSRL